MAEFKKNNDMLKVEEQQSKIYEKRRKVWVMFCGFLMFMFCVLTLCFYGLIGLTKLVNTSVTWLELIGIFMLYAVYKTGVIITDSK